jgi:Group II intron, maturase-specific domain
VVHASRQCNRAEGYAHNDPGLKLRSRTDVSLADIARKINPLLRGWIEYYGRYMPSALRPFLRYVNQMLRAWAMRKFKRFAGHTTRTGRFLEKLSQTNPRLFVHWQIGIDGSEVRRESHASFCERPGCNSSGLLTRAP